MNFTLRPWNISDLDSLAFHANDIDIAKNMTDKFPFPYTKEDGEKFIAMATADNPVHIFAIDVNGKAVGGIGIHPQQDIMKKNAELGYWLGKQYWNNGIVSKAIIQMIDFGFKTYDITRIFARPFGTNMASQKVLEKNGFILEARLEKIVFKNGEYLDDLIYAVRKPV